MPDGSLNTDDLLFWVTELQQGRPNAAEPTFRKIVTRVEILVRGMFARFPRVGRFVDAEDVTQGSLVRLLAAFRNIRPASTRHFYGLANELIRRELLDLVKHFYGPRGHGSNVTCVPIGEADGELSPPAPEETELEQYAALHAAVETLPAEEREVFGLAYYHGWTQAQIGNLLGVSVRTVQRWQDAAAAALRVRVSNS